MIEKQVEFERPIFLAIAELSTLSPGLIEGALHAGTEVASRVTSTLR